jgi:N6-L-threonylcarbamoyladenine synthase
MHILGIESSCDETAAAVLGPDGSLLSDTLYSQVPIHAPFGGIVPELASRAHLGKIGPVVDSALEQAGIGLGDLDGIAVTRGPGLVGSLLVGVSYAKALGYVLDKPVLGIHHLEGHLLAPFIGQARPGFPFVGLVVSGGHTSLYDVQGLGRYELLGRTRDDAAGEAFDKGAKLLGLGYPGGPAIEASASGGDPKAVALPRGMWAKGGFDTSFSGLKTALYTHVRKTGVPSGADLADLCASLQEAVVDVLVRKTQLAVMARGARRVVISGGVAANTRLRHKMRQMCERRDLELCIAPREHCTDNGAMIALAGQLRLAAGLVSDGVALDGVALDLTADAGWELGGTP